MTAEVANPVTVEQRMTYCSEQIHAGVKICDERYRIYLKADHDFDVAFAQAMVEQDGAIALRKYHAELATRAERKARDEALAAYKYAERRARAFVDELGSWQSVNKSVLAMYGAAGVTER